MPDSVEPQQKFLLKKKPIKYLVKEPTTTKARRLPYPFKEFSESIRISLVSEKFQSRQIYQGPVFLIRTQALPKLEKFGH